MAARHERPVDEPRRMVLGRCKRTDEWQPEKGEVLLSHAGHEQADFSEHEQTTEVRTAEVRVPEDIQ